ncbi:MAG TPA: carboxypeptidase regulatory-like domain-containing protein [Longimicrobium sp.]|nr:carboxypeptidase regulatory-like domain-containing protein [Longimicrobium sp.]
MIRSCASLILALAATAPATAQDSPSVARENVRLEGRVLSADDGRPLGLAAVEVAGLQQVTDEEGRFRFDRVPAGEHELMVERLGYGESTQPIRVDGGGPVEVRLTADAELVRGIAAATDRLEYRIRKGMSLWRVLDKREVVAYCWACVNERFVTRLYVDDFPAGGITTLQNLPTIEIARVKMLGNGSTVRVYTDAFMEWAARSNYQPGPLGSN